LDAFSTEPYLLDGRTELVEKLLTPWLALAHATESSSEQVELWSRAVYQFVKVRGWKAAVSFFPHAVHDLPFLLDCFRSPKMETLGWQAVYLHLLWLGLVCRLPFALDRFVRSPEETPAPDLWNIGINYANRAGKEREAAAQLLSALCIRFVCIAHLEL
jgi:hypothetical protein